MTGTGREMNLDRQQIWSKLKANNTFTQLVDYQLEVDKGKLTAVANLKS